LIHDFNTFVDRLAMGGGEYWQVLFVSTNWTGVMTYKELNPKSLGGCRILTLGIPDKGIHTIRH